MKRYLAIAFFLLFTALQTNAQQLRVSVLERDGRQPVFLAYVNVYDGNTHAMLNTVQTNEVGEAVIGELKYPVTIDVIASGYESFSKDYTTAPLNTNLTVKLTKKFASLNEVVVTGLSRPEKMKDALANYRVITKAMIQAQGAVTLDEVLKSQLNMNVGNDGVLGSTLKMQGMAGDKVKILIDGIPVNGRENGNINLSQLNLNNAERIEVVQGPMSVVYGTDALGGVINIITRKDNKPLGINLNAFYQSAGKYNLDGSITFKAAERNQFSLGGGRNYFDGAQPITTSNSYNGDTIFSSRSLYFKPVEQYIGNLAYNYTAKSSFRLNFASDYLNEKTTNKGSITTFNPFGIIANDEYYRTTRLSNRLALQGNLGKTGTWQSQNGYVVYYRTRESLIKNLNTLSEALDESKGAQDTSTFTNVYLRSSYSNKVWKLNYTAGYDVNLEKVKSLKVDGINKDMQDYAVYANVSTPLIKDRLTAQLGGRASYNSKYNVPLMPSVSLLYTPTDKIQVRASYSNGFRVPSTKELYLSFIDANHHIIGNPNLTAEKSKNIQLSGSYQAYEKGADYLQFILTGYYNDVTNGIALVKSDTIATSIAYTYGPVLHQSNIIGNLQIDGQWKGLHAQLGVSNNHTLGEPDNIPKNVPGYAAFDVQEITANLTYYWKKPQLSISFIEKYNGSSPYQLPSIEGYIIYQGKQGGYHICDASIDKKFFDKKLQLTVGVKNVFDVQQLQLSGVSGSAGGAHGSSTTSANFLPRSLFTALRLNLD
jgi:outer membrane receptor for ferrienterochelin and colicins